MLRTPPQESGPFRTRLVWVSERLDVLGSMQKVVVRRGPLLQWRLRLPAVARMNPLGKVSAVLFLVEVPVVRLFS